METREEIRQFKLYKIQEANARINQYQEIYDEINENQFLKISKKATSKLGQFMFMALGFTFLFIFIVCFFNKSLHDFFSTHYDLFLTESTFKLLVLIIQITSFSIALTFLAMSYLIESNNKKRDTLSGLSALVDDMMNYMRRVSEDERLRYEYYIDAEADLKKEMSVKNL